MNKHREQLVTVLRDNEDELVRGWLAASGTDASHDGFRSTRDEAQGLVASLRNALESDADSANFHSAGWDGLRNGLEALSRSRAEKGQSAADTSAFVLSLKDPLFDALNKKSAGSGNGLVAAITNVSRDVDQMAQWTVSTYQLAREEIIARQQEELLELSTPVIKLWEGVLAVPMIGTLDSNRTQMVMEVLLQRIVETESGLAIIDITGVPTVDTLVAQHLLKTVTAIRLMGADCIISGIRPQIAQTIVHLGIDLQGVTTKATLADALATALKRGGYVVTRPQKT